MCTAFRGLTHVQNYDISSNFQRLLPHNITMRIVEYCGTPSAYLTIVAIWIFILTVAKDWRRSLALQLITICVTVNLKYINHYERLLYWRFDNEFLANAEINNQLISHSTTIIAHHDFYSTQKSWYLEKIGAMVFHNRHSFDKKLRQLWVCVWW